LDSQARNPIGVAGARSRHSYLKWKKLGSGLLLKIRKRL